MAAAGFHHRLHFGRRFRKHDDIGDVLLHDVTVALIDEQLVVRTQQTCGATCRANSRSNSSEIALVDVEGAIKHVHERTTHVLRSVSKDKSAVENRNRGLSTQNVPCLCFSGSGGNAVVDSEIVAEHCTRRKCLPDDHRRADTGPDTWLLMLPPMLANTLARGAV